MPKKPTFTIDKRITPMDWLNPTDQHSCVQQVRLRLQCVLRGEKVSSS